MRVPLLRFFSKKRTMSFSAIMLVAITKKSHDIVLRILTTEILLVVQNFSTALKKAILAIMLAFVLTINFS